jgi:PAS domain S-box-containing protein
MHADAADHHQFALQVLKNAPVVILVLDLEGRIQHVNSFFERLAGYRLDEVRGRDWFDTLLPERDRERIRALFGQSRGGAHVSGYVNAIVTRAGDERQIEWADEFLRDNEGRAIGIVAIGQDVTERLAAELRHRSVVAAMHDGVVVQSSSGEIISCNLAAERMLGLTADQMAGRTSMDPRWHCVHEDGTPFPGETHPAMVTLRTGAPATDVVMGVYRPEGDLVWLSVNSEPLLRPGDHAVVGAVTSFSDITERKRAEGALKDERERLRDAQRIAKLGSWELDLVTNSLAWSEEIFQIFEIDHSRFGASYEAFLEATHPDDRAAVDAAYQESVASRALYKIVHRLLMPDGRLKWVQERGQTYYDAAGRPLRSVGTVQDISAQVQAELRLRGIFDGMFAFVGLYDLDGNVIEANRAPLEIAGLRREDVIGKPFWEAYWWSYARETQDQVRTVLARAAAGEVVRDDFVVRIGGGRFITIDAMFGPLRDANGRVGAVVGSGVDITERKNAEDAARRSAELLRTVIGGAPVVMFALDTQGVFTFSEGRALEKLGLHPGQMVGASALEVYSSVPGFEEVFRRALSGEQATLASNLGSIAFEAAYAPSYDARGEIDGVIGVGFDVTDRVAAEEGMRDREARLAAVFNHTSDAMLLLSADADGTLRVAAANRSFVDRIRRVKQVDEADLLGLTFEELSLDIYQRPPEVLAQYQESLRRVIATRAPLTFEHSIIFPTGLFFAEVTLVPVLDRAGACVQVLWSSRDVTQRRLADAQVRASLAEKETLLREIHHRVKNNLQVIAGLLHFQSKKLRASEDVAAFAELRQRIFAMTLLHERLYQSPDVAHVVFCDYVRALVAELVRSFAPRPGIRIEVRTTNDVLLPLEMAMPGGMIVTELVTNVFKHAFPGTREGTATVSVRTVGDRIVLGVDDDGVGFPDGLIPGAESSFGWDLVRTLVLQLDGTVEATTDRGAHVRVSFAAPPLAEGPPA